MEIKIIRVIGEEVVFLDIKIKEDLLKILVILWWDLVEELVYLKDVI